MGLQKKTSQESLAGPASTEVPVMRWYGEISEQADAA